MLSLYERTKKIDVAVSIEIKTLILRICQIHPLCHIFFWMISEYFFFKSLLV